MEVHTRVCQLDYVVPSTCALPLVRPHLSRSAPTSLPREEHRPHLARAEPAARLLGLRREDGVEDREQEGRVRPVRRGEAVGATKPLAAASPMAASAGQCGVRGPRCCDTRRDATATCASGRSRSHSAKPAARCATPSHGSRVTPSGGARCGGNLVVVGWASAERISPH